MPAAKVVVGKVLCEKILEVNRLEEKECIIDGKAYPNKLIDSLCEVDVR